MQNELKAIQRRVGTTFVHVTHDQDEAMAVADRIVVMNHGHIEHFGTPEQVYLQPRTLFSAEFMGKLNRIPVKADGGAVSSPLGRLDIAPFTGLLCLRPENIGLEGTLHLGPARLTEAAFFGSHHRCTFAPLAAPEITLTAHLPQGTPLHPDAQVELYARNPVLLPEV